MDEAAMTEIDAPPEAEPTAPSTLIGIGKPGAWAILALFITTEAVFAFTTFDAVKTPWICVMALVVVSGAGVLVALPHEEPFPQKYGWYIILAIIVSTALISWQLADEGTLEREAWHFGAISWLLFFLAIRGRPGMAWFGFASLVAVSEVWAFDVGRDLMDIPNQLQTHAGILLVGTLFARALRRASARINSLNLRSIDLAAAAASADAEQEIRRERVAELAEVATPLLARISRSLVVSDVDRLDYILAEATLRDSVRARGLHLPEIIVATTAARKRGVEVTLLDDRGGGLPTERAMQLLTARITESLRNVSDGRLTIRLAPPGREVAASLVVESQGRSHRVDLDEAGLPIDTRPPE
jgi:hypothetical protein